MLQPVVAVYAKPFGQSGRPFRHLDWGKWIVELTLQCTHVLRWEVVGRRGVQLHKPGPTNPVRFKRMRALPYADCLACGPSTAPFPLGRPPRAAGAGQEGRRAGARGLPGPGALMDPTSTPEFFCHTPVDRSGLAAYCHLVMGPDDPKRSSRPKGGRADRAPHKTNAKLPVEYWRRQLVIFFADGKTATFNHFCVEVLDQEASICHESNVDAALWELVEDGLLEHTMEIPILFRRATHDCG